MPDNDKSAKGAEPVKTVNVVSSSPVEAPEPPDAPEVSEVDESDESDDVVLQVVNLPFYVTDYVAEDKDGNKVVFTKDGTPVPSADADDFIEAAASNGVVLNRKVN